MIELLPVNVTYEPFSHQPEYIEANRGFIARQPLGHVGRFLDLACGTGTVSQLLLEQSPQAHLNGVDLDPVQIQLSAERFLKLGYEVRFGSETTDEYVNGKPVLVFGEGSAGELPFADETFDCITIANAIHLIEDKPQLLASAARLLKPGGVFGFNSAFYSGSIPAGTDRFYLDWIRKATQHIEAKNVALKAQGKPTIQRVRGTTRRAFTNRWYSPREWSDMLAAAGLSTIVSLETRVELSEQSFSYVGAYGGLAEVLLSGFPVAEASEGLQAAAVPAMRAAGFTVAPRNFLDVWAKKA
ncbi:MAG TPA: class I SAM-dependent methyltransferase [Pirellulales bacterium]|jgi:ubiquinone/menaquinone biosynthesis C-methylase UbiE|nr:class I SAM-dependent methyltransferase [Pirellulales bacterium]